MESVTNKEMSNKEYWEQYTPNYSEGEEEDFESRKNHDINLEIVCKFKGLNGGVVYETKEKAINCNMGDLQIWFSNLLKSIRMVDETISDKEVEGLA
jgi:hypothetical protein|tara:strand:- start:715 stop:1005 length:291 start_codon:yes stop_codon:yes gene_type:complete